MKRIYTNFIQASLCLTFIMLLGTTATAQCDVPAPEGAVWGTQFDGGLDGWMALDGNFMERKRADGTDIGWEWTVDGDVSDGAFAGNAPAYASPSICNGAVRLNSDLLDNLGVPTFGAGECPGPCNSILMSPTIDLSEVDASNFILQFASQHRQFTSEYNILISTDDGATWTDTVEVFSDGYIEALVNSPHLFNESVRVPLCDLGNEREVRLAIWYNANYYYWTIDDLYIIGIDEPDLQVNQNFFSSTTSWTTPHDQEVPLCWLADISNQSPVDSDGSTLTVSVTKNGEEVHSQDLAYEAIAGCGDEQNRIFPESFTPEAAEGDVFTVSYTITDNAGDAFEPNNVASAEFVYSENVWATLPEERATRDSRFGAATVFQSFGRGFKVVNGPDAEGNPRFVENVRFGIDSDNADPLEEGTINIALYEWIDIDLDGEVDGDPANEKVKLGDTTIIVDANLEDPANLRVTPRTPNGEKIMIESDKSYVVLAHFNPGFGGVSDRYYHIRYLPTESDRDFDDTAMEFAYTTKADDNLTDIVGTLGAVNGVTDDEGDRDGTREFINVFWGSMYFDVEITPSSTGADDINENIGINIYPNPTAEKLTADISLENMTDVMNVEILDMTGKTVMTKSYNNVLNQKINLDIQTLVDGVYIMNIRSADGINTQKFTVANSK